LSHFSHSGTNSRRVIHRVPQAAAHNRTFNICYGAAVFQLPRVRTVARKSSVGGLYVFPRVLDIMRTYITYSSLLSFV